ncbi:hypothetical protein Dxin01_04206 [Deinococcus xinjiangensis]|uniref:Uncharacterized protein n=1 Tax=Deinococcus xinjiangensis TaxID=457454 RepID=A0ABP9VGU9_9DEIO
MQLLIVLDNNKITTPLERVQAAAQLQETFNLQGLEMEIASTLGIGGVLRKRYRWRSQAGTGSRTKRAVLVVALGRPCHQAKMRPRLIPAAVAIPCKRSFASPR